ncbi:MAG: 1-(5-phosphoribosyl)-5-[(5-phosphoribosylamino)methylideneamino]imidazole-4-carboxamide isomerase [Methanobacterium sp. BRmetb2]|jgi:phosphoribosylformimino-5-aminoimidazole carboxamide ribotide isomerase|nr:MAG: 1-(5-phosphoribosyl)-5-[(5-phosphoribosylamino)methylideneamino]imidazole-4-carboxamide isomerase [Methanobacterium sp. BRmetb2]
MLIIPAVDLKNGKCVQLVQGKPGTEQIVIDDPVKVARQWESQGARLLHLINLDGAFGEGKKNQEIIEKIVDEISIPIQLGGGIRTRKDATDLLEKGIDKVILGTMAIENPENVTELAEEFGKDRIIVALDSKESKVVIKGWTQKTDKTAPEFAKIFEEKGAGCILYTNVDVEGLMQGFKIEPALDLMEAVKIPVIYSGGITSLNDLRLLKNSGIYGVVIGSALYKGKIDFKEALNL